MNPRRAVLVFSIRHSWMAGMFALAACSDSTTAPNRVDNENPPPPPPLTARTVPDLSYGSHPLQRMDVYLPANRTSATPVVFVLHGGGFVLGDKADIAVQSQALASRGFAVVNVNYRLVDTTGLLQLPPLRRDSDVRIHDQVNDLDAAVRLVADSAASWNVRTSRWAMVGHSAGGTLALLYTYGHGNNNGDARVSIAGNWAGLTNFAFNSDPRINEVDPRWKEAIHRIIGHEIAPSTTLAYMAVSPYWIANNGHAKATINILPEHNIVGDLPDESLAEYTAFVNLLNQKGVTNRYVLVAGADHGFGQPGNWQLVLDETAAFIQANVQ